MKIDMSTVLKNMDGSDVELPDGKSTDEKSKKVKLTLGHVCTNSLLNVYNDEKNLESKVKLSRFEMALKIKHCNDESVDKGVDKGIDKGVDKGLSKGKVDFTVEEISELKNLINLSYNTLIVGQSLKLLEGQEVIF